MKNGNQSPVSAQNGNSQNFREWNGLNRDWHPEVDNAIKQTVDWHKSDAFGLVLSGGYGCGKTSIARIVIKAAGGPTPMMERDGNGDWVQIINAVIYSEPELLAAIKEGYGRNNNDAAIVRRCRQARLLVLDDIGAAYVRDESRPWYEDILWRILNERDKPGKKTMLTTNLSPAELKVRLGGRAHSRLKGLVDEAHYCQMFNVPDYRARNWSQSQGDQVKMELR